MKWLSLAALILILDQISKQWANSVLVYHQSRPVLPFFDLTLTYNTGAAFSFLSDAGGWQRWAFAALAVIVSVVIVLWLRRIPAGRLMLPLGLALILGGALGNLVDRVMYGYVIDFIDLYYADWHWPAFNVADSAISGGAVAVLLDAFLNVGSELDSKEDAGK